MSEELRPCPFCGGNDIVYEEALSVTYCNDCGGELDEGFGSDWNTRPIEDALQSRIAELEKDLSNKEIEYTDLWDDALALQARIAELEALVERLIEAGDRLSDSLCTYPEEEKTIEVCNWNAIVAEYKECEK